MIKKILSLLSLAVLITGIAPRPVFSQGIPDKPDPPHLVNDFAGMLHQDEVSSLEQRLVAFNDSTSTQISIVIVPSLGGYDKADYAQRLGQKWGIGKKELNNGILILVKPKQPDSDGQVFIAQGYGLEGAIPDLTCRQIVDIDILPAFRAGDYYGGLIKATNTIMALARGEYSAETYGLKAKKKETQHLPFGLILFIIFVIILMVGKGSGGSNNKHIGSGGLPFWMLLGMMNSGGSHSGSWGGFSGGGGGGGGFGGFGGGGFGGGGAGGSW